MAPSLIVTPSHRIAGLGLGALAKAGPPGAGPNGFQVRNQIATKLTHVVDKERSIMLVDYRTLSEN